MTKKKTKKHAKKKGPAQWCSWGWVNTTTGRRVKKRANFLFFFSVPAYVWSVSSLVVARSQCGRNEHVVRLEIRGI